MTAFEGETNRLNYDLRKKNSLNIPNQKHHFLLIFI